MNGIPNDFDAKGLITVELEGIENTHGTDEGHTTTRNHAFLYGCAGGVEGVFYPCLLFFHFDLGGRSHMDDGHTADQLGETLLKLLAIVIGGGVGDLATDLTHPCPNIVCRAIAIDHGGVVFGHHDAPCLAKVIEGQ